MKGFTALVDLVGSDDPVEPASMQFESKPGEGCRSCLFRGQRTAVCREANRLAILAGYKDCDDGVVYVPIITDLKQISIV